MSYTILDSFLALYPESEDSQFENYHPNIQAALVELRRISSDGTVRYFSTDDWGNLLTELPFMEGGAEVRGRVSDFCDTLLTQSEYDLIQEVASSIEDAVEDSLDTFTVVEDADIISEDDVAVASETPKSTLAPARNRNTFRTFGDSGHPSDWNPKTDMMERPVPKPPVELSEEDKTLREIMEAAGQEGIHKDRFEIAREVEKGLEADRVVAYNGPELIAERDNTPQVDSSMPGGPDQKVVLKVSDRYPTGPFPAHTSRVSQPNDGQPGNLVGQVKKSASKAPHTPQLIGASNLKPSPITLKLNEMRSSVGISKDTLLDLLTKMIKRGSLRIPVPTIVSETDSPHAEPVGYRLDLIDIEADEDGDFVLDFKMTEASGTEVPVRNEDLSGLWRSEPDVSEAFGLKSVVPSVEEDFSKTFS